METETKPDFFETEAKNLMLAIQYGCGRKKVVEALKTIATAALMDKAIQAQLGAHTGGPSIADYFDNVDMGV